MPAQFDVVVAIVDIRRLQSALRRLRRRILSLKDDMPYRSAVGYQHLLIKAITTRMFTYSLPYNQRYKEWKQEMVGHQQFWKLYGDLLKSLTAFKVGTGWMGGVPAGAMDRGGKSWFGTPQRPMGKPKSIVMYGRVNEARRPLFEPAALVYAQGGWRKEGTESLLQLKRAWR